MNHINVVIQNPIFLTIFMGTAVLALVLVAGLMGWTASPSWILIAAALYLAGNMAVSFAINVPMNNTLAAADSDGTSSETLWVMFLDRWVF